MDRKKSPGHKKTRQIPRRTWNKPLRPASSLVLLPPQLAEMPYTNTTGAFQDNCGARSGVEMKRKEVHPEGNNLYGVIVAGLTAKPSQASTLTAASLVYDLMQSLCPCHTAARFQDFSFCFITGTVRSSCTTTVTSGTSKDKRKVNVAASATLLFSIQLVILASVIIQFHTPYFPIFVIVFPYVSFRVV